MELFARIRLADLTFAVGEQAESILEQAKGGMKYVTSKEIDEALTSKVPF